MHSERATKMAQQVKNPPANAGNIKDADSIPGSERPPGGGNGNPLPYSCLGNPREKEPGGLQLMESQRVPHDWVTKHICTQGCCNKLPGTGLKQQKYILLQFWRIDVQIKMPEAPWSLWDPGWNLPLPFLSISPCLPCIATPSLQSLLSSSQGDLSLVCISSLLRTQILLD